MEVPFIDITRYEPSFLDAVLTSTSDLIVKGQFVGGPIVSQAEEKLTKFTESKFTVGCANGTDAIQLGLRALGVDRDDTVLIPDMTFWATYEAVVNVGGNVVTVDVEKDSLHIGIENFKKAAEEYKPKAAIIVHLYGHASPDTKAIRTYCADNGIELLEDCAQAIGVRLDGESLIATAKMATTSFYPAKVLGASGDAGAIFCQTAEHEKTLRTLVNHGRSAHYEHSMIGWNSRMGAYEANYLYYALDFLQRRIDSRNVAVERYKKEITCEHLNFVNTGDAIVENGYCSVATMEPAKRVEFISYLKENGIGFGTIYPGAMSKQPGATFLKGRVGGENADWISQAVINLPCFAYIKEEEISYVIDKVNSF